MPQSKPTPEKPEISSAAYAGLALDVQVRLLVSFLRELSRQLGWVGDALGGHGLCARARTHAR